MMQVRRPSARLTPKGVSDAQPRRSGRYEISDGGTGLYLVVQPTSEKSWVVRYRFDKRPVKYMLGKWPLIDLKDARLAAAAALHEVAHGRDPAAARRAQKVAPVSKIVTLGDAYGQYRTAKLDALRSGHDTHMRLQKYVISLWSERDIRSITSDEITDLIEDIVVDGEKVVTANRVRSTLFTFFEWVRKKRKYVSDNPCDGVETVGAEPSRDRVLSRDEIRIFLLACRKMPAPWGQFGRMLLLTGQRRSEVAGMTTDEVNIDEWTIPKERTKNKTVHDVPLSSAALVVMSELDVEIAPGKNFGYYFTTSKAGPIVGFSKTKLKIAELMSEIHMGEHEDAMSRLPLGERVPVSDIPRWTFHDLRRTAATGLQALGVRKEVTGAVLNHSTSSKDGLERVYQRHQYADEKRAALEAWAEELARMEAKT